MSRPLRLLVAGGWYHVVNRGNRREKIFRTDEDRRRFLVRLAELPERFHVEIHAFVLMDNHYHLLLRTLEPNLSHAIRWLQVAYSSTFNWAHQLRGHVFQGRFNAVLIQKEEDLPEVARYLHLNPVRVCALALGKAQQRQARVMGIDDPGLEVVSRRLRILDDYAWSSWRVYSGAEAPPGWLETGLIGRACGGRSRAERRAAIRAYTEAPLRQGRIDCPWDHLVGGAVLGEVAYAWALLQEAKAEPDEQTGARALARAQRIAWPGIVAAAEGLAGRKWDTIRDLHGDWIRDGTVFVAVRYLGYRLAEVYGHEPGWKYQAAAQAVRRFAEKLKNDPARQRFVTDLRRCARNL